MNDAPPEKIEASDEDLRSLCHGLVGYGVSGQQDKAWGVWLLRRNRPPLLAVSDSRDIVFKFEVFTLALRAPEEVLSAASEYRSRMADTLSKLNNIGMTVLPLEALPEHLRPDETRAWPFTHWQVEVLWQRDWTIPVEKVSDDWWANPDTASGAVPIGADHACLVAKGLLFTGTNGSQLLVSQGEMALDLLVTQDPESILAATVGTLAVGVEQYLTGPDPSF
ncbi:hypothetical protein QCD71_22195 [Sphingomonas sp. PsM26]|jgi:hypothetical protein|nr:hypothetical protein [Sphingomonas sp. PsM26]